MASVKEQVFDYVKRTYGIVPDYPFPTAPEYPVLRPPGSRKWFALLMDVPRSRLGLAGEERVEIINLKCSPAMAGSLRSQPGIFPAYHMNRDSWISVLLDGTVSIEDLIPLVDLSFQLTDDKKRSEKKQFWLVPANPKYYDLEGALRASTDRSFLWKQSSRVRIGDIVYIYMAAPVSGIQYKCRAVEVDIPYRHQSEQVSMSRVMRLKLLKTYRKPIGRETLKAHGVTTVRGPRYMPLSLLEELEPGVRG